jgi:non-specific serine/threonine protein kinase
VGPALPDRLHRLRYVEALDATQVRRRLGVGKTQYYADHRRAVAAVVDLLWQAPHRGASQPEHEHDEGPAVSPPDRPPPPTRDDGGRRGGSGGTGDAWGSLPQPLTSFVGRARELAEVRRLLGTTRLLTLTGTGGTGKTRLALQAAADLVDGYPDGARFVDLAPLADPALVPQAAAAAVGVREEPGRPVLATLADALRRKRLLLVLDNCEHLLDASARLADALLRACPRVHLLATSREALGIGGETPWRVPSLRLPDPGHLPPVAALSQCEAVRLFLERAVTVQPGFAVTNQNAPAVARLCWRLDGIPLALELAAARLRVLSVDQVLGRLEDGFRLLTGGSRTALPRQQTLQATVDWSYDLLEEQERQLLRRLAVFTGGWTLAAAEAVGAGAGIAAEDVLDLLTRLVDTSLVEVDDRRAGAPRYRLLETLRAYGRQRLAASGEAPAVHRRHAAYYLALVEQVQGQIPGPLPADWVFQLEPEQENLRAALRWLTDHGPTQDALRLGGALGPFWHVHADLTEGRAALALLLAQPAAAGATRARVRALAAAGTLAWAQGDNPGAQAVYAEGLGLAEALGDREGRALVLLGQGTVAVAIEDWAAARPRLEASLAIWRALGNPTGAAHTLVQLARVVEQEASAGGRALLEEALALWRGLSDRLGQRHGRYNLGRHLLDAGDPTAAGPLLEAAVAAARAPGLRLEVAIGLGMLGNARLALGEVAAARACFEESGRLARALGHTRWRANMRQQLALVALAAGEARAAARFLEETMALRRELGLDAQELRWRSGWTLGLLGATALEQGDAGRAAGLVAQSLAVWPELDAQARTSYAHRWVPYALEVLAGVAAQGPPERAVRLRAAATAHRARGDARPYDLWLPRAIWEPLVQRWLAPVREALSDTAAAAVWQEGQTMSLEHAIAYALEEPQSVAQVAQVDHLA